MEGNTILMHQSHRLSKKSYFVEIMWHFWPLAAGGPNLTSNITINRQRNNRVQALQYQILFQGWGPIDHLTKYILLTTTNSQWHKIKFELHCTALHGNSLSSES